ncbi:MAG: carbohydrate porin [Gammaproteobacteria bacterium]
MRQRSIKIIIWTTIFIAIISPNTSSAYDLTDSISIEATATAIAQHADLDNVLNESGNEISDTGRSATTLDIGINFHPTDNDEFQIIYSFAEGEAINGIGGFSLAPFADDLEEDLSDINSSDRYNLLEAWYKHTFDFNEQASLGITTGIISSSGYIDDNEYANDEVSQFMNDIFVNNTLANLPDYDVGAALEFESGLWSVKAVALESENEDRNDYNYYAFQIGHHVTTHWGAGNYRVYAFSTNDEFIDNDGIKEDKLIGYGLSMDQQISENIGFFARLAWQEDKVPVDHNEMISFGLSIAGNRWNRPNDTFGAAIAFLDGASKSSSEINNTQVFEAYYKYLLTDHFDLTLDAQWIEDNLRESKDPEGALLALRFNANF